MQKISKWIKSMTHKIVSQIKFVHKCHTANLLWASCFSLHPPSFYMKYTSEEAEQIVTKEKAELELMRIEYERKYLKTNIR